MSPVAEGLTLLLNHFNWNRVFLISSKGGDHGALGQGVRDVLEAGDFKVVRWVQNVEKAPDLELSRIEAIYSLAKPEARSEG